jgi:DNA-binding transcriptional LysR family regulator
MELRQLATFRMVAETLSFSRTAQALNYVQSSVTAQIQALEEELGVRLFKLAGMLLLSKNGREDVFSPALPKREGRCKRGYLCSRAHF